jgi:hypothetical protein
VFEDAGYVLQSGGHQWSSAVLANADVSAPDDAGTCTIKGQLGLVNRLPLTTSRFLILRLLNLTVFRSIRLGAFVRRHLVQRLITRRKAGPFTLARVVHFRADRVAIRDRLERTGVMRVDRVTWTTGFSPFHMGSSRYFLARELRGSPDTDLAAAARALSSGGNAMRQVEVSFGPDGAVTLVEGDPAFGDLPGG